MSRIPGEEVLTVRLKGYGNWATVSRKPDCDEVEVVRYWEPEPDPNAKDDSPYTEYAAMLKASRRMAARRHAGTGTRRRADNPCARPRW